MLGLLPSAEFEDLLPAKLAAQIGADAECRAMTGRFER
jgi:hypothetical protein